MKIFKLLTLFVALLALIAFQNCSEFTAVPVKNNLSSLSAMEILEAKAFTVINNRCTSCHSGGVALGGIDYIANLDSLLFYRKIIPGEPELSPIYNVIQSGQMPPGMPLSASETKAIYDWIHDGLATGSVGVAPPPPSGTTLTATFTSINNNILKTKCLSCHNSTTSSGGVNYSSYTSAMNTVQAGNPGASSLYTSVNGGAMPKGGTKLSVAELSAIQNWIQNNALNN